ncbi:MAG TPA: M20/M25/M40 family metallo-hydrolase [Nitrospiraceae bacterium]|nr:M20/M25/M40 family metallo-hydrolase [Nitrospiraceae bacterium]
MMTTEVRVTQIAGIPPPEFGIKPTASAEPIQVGIDYLPILDSPSINVTAPFVFVGYGISDTTHGWDEYAGIDARNRIVVFLRGKPESYGFLITHADKIRAAREHGAAAFLTFTGPIMSPYEARRGMSHAPLAFYNQMGQEQSFPGAWIHTDLAERLVSSKLSSIGRSLGEVQQQLQTLTQQSFETDTHIHLKWDSEQEAGTLNNVLGLFPGGDPSLAQETVIIGAHRDHFGPQAGLVFPGADDNASGTAVLLEAARVLTESGLTPKRSLLFVSFSGEEQGLLGSRLYVSRPPRPLPHTVTMINIDHAGVGNGRLTVGVTGLDKSLAANAGEHAALAGTVDLFGFFPGGDHVPFKEAGVPTVTVVSGGPHPHFHQQSDTPDTVDPEILERTVRYVIALAWQSAN